MGNRTIKKSTKNLFGSIAIFFFSSSFVVASERVHYTCFVTLQDQSKIVHQFVSLEETKKEFLQRLPSRSVYFSNGVSGSTVKSVHECITGKKNFESKEARSIQAITPM